MIIFSQQYVTICIKSTNTSKVGEQDKENLAEWAAQSLKHIAFDQVDEIFPIVFDSLTDEEDGNEHDENLEKEDSQNDNNEETVQKSPEKSENISEIDELLAKTSIDP